MHTNHRSRMDRKIADSGLEFLPEHEQLEVILFAVIKRGDTNKVAHALLERFGSIAEVLSAEPEDLVKVDGVGLSTARFLTHLKTVLGIVQRGMYGISPVLRESRDWRGYAASLFYDKTVETCMLVSLTSKYQVIRFDKLSEGTLDESPLYIQTVVKTALKNNAYYVILAHNHPGGECRPSGADIRVTRQIDQALRLVDVKLLDHVIAAEGESFSMREQGFLEY